MPEVDPDSRCTCVPYQGETVWCVSTTSAPYLTATRIVRGSGEVLVQRVKKSCNHPFVMVARAAPIEFCTTANAQAFAESADGDSSLVVLYRTFRSVQWFSNANAQGVGAKFCNGAESRCSERDLVSRS